MIYIGIDVAKDKHDCFAISSDGEVLFEKLTIKNTLDGFNLLIVITKAINVIPSLLKSNSLCLISFFIRLFFKLIPPFIKYFDLSKLYFYEILDNVRKNKLLFIFLIFLYLKFLLFIYYFFY